MHEAALASVMVGVVGIVVALAWLPGRVRAAAHPAGARDTASAHEGAPEHDATPVLIEA